MNKELEQDIADPPSTTLGMLRHLGPGLILAGSIVGSGELIATTRTGAEAGFTFLWLIIIGCIIKVFTQIELARYAISSRKTTLRAMNDLPGPRILGGNWIVWFWLIMFTAGIGQLGGIVGGVGQALSLSWPLTEQGRTYNAFVTLKTERNVLERKLQANTDEERQSRLQTEFDAITSQISTSGDVQPSNDDKIWAVIISVLTVFMLTWGNFSFIERFCMIMVGAFTFVTIGNLFALQTYPDWAIGWAELKEGLSFGLPELSDEQKAKGMSPLTTALAAFGIIGVGSSELVAYPYWCLEKGYGRAIGPDDGTKTWSERAAGWLRVMRFDAWLSMIVYTFSTIAFYLLGAAILSRAGIIPAGADMIRTLSVMYEPVFGDTAQVVFLFGAFAVLFSTFFSANAAKTRMAADVISVVGFVKMDEEKRGRWIKGFSVFFPAACALIYIYYPEPVTLILIAGVMQSLLLPMLGFAALYFRYKKCHPDLTPNKIWDIMLWMSFACFLVVGIYLVYAKLFG
ncbi:MAG: Nramp family divalent metal transporter [Verrucomicrobiota bacterium]